MKSRHIHIHTHTHSLHVGFRTSKFAQMAARFLLQLIDLALAALQGLESCARSLDEERRRIREDKSELAKYDKHVGIREALATNAAARPTIHGVLRRMSADATAASRARRIKTKAPSFAVLCRGRPSA